MQRTRIHEVERFVKYIPPNRNLQTEIVRKAEEAIKKINGMDL